MAERDVITLLLDQHQQIRRLLGELETAEGEARRNSFEQLVRLLAVHETAEEEIVHPAATMAGAFDVASARTMEEVQAKQLLADLETVGVEHPSFGERLARLRQAVLDHAAREEEQEFPRLRTFYPDFQLRAMAAAVTAAEAVAPTHAHRLGPHDAVGNLILGPSIAVVDRIRDALRDVSRTWERSRR
jgi:hemerythrin superfamily protein